MDIWGGNWNIYSHGKKHSLIPDFAAPQIRYRYKLSLIYKRVVSSAFHKVGERKDKKLHIDWSINRILIWYIEITMWSTVNQEVLHLYVLVYPLPVQLEKPNMQYFLRRSVKIQGNGCFCKAIGPFIGGWWLAKNENRPTTRLQPKSPKEETSHVKTN